MTKSTRRKSRLNASAARLPVEDNKGPGRDPEENAKEARSLLKKRLFGYDVPSVFWLAWGLESQKRQLTEVFEQCVKFGESNSALVIGPRGSGKTKLIEKALQDLDVSSENFFIINLNGCVQTDDRTALQEIARQLDLENVVGDQVFGSFADNLAFIIDSFSCGSQETRSVIVILDEFDLFAQHKNQSLIYNLLDVSRNKQTPISVVGVTCRLDIVELLEKRVKSRYSHRSILTFSSLNFDEYLKMTKEMLMLPTEFEDKKFRDKWNENIESSFGLKSTREAVRRHFYKTKDIRSITLNLAQVVCKISNEKSFVTEELVLDVFRSQEIDGKSQMLQDLSVLELCLIVAMKHVIDRRSGEPFNFDMIFKEYQKFVLKRSTTVQRFEKPVALKAFEHLVALEIVKPLHSINQSSLPEEFQPMNLLVDSMQISEALAKYTGCPTDLQQWGSSTIL